MMPGRFESASPTACAPSTRKHRSRSRKARFFRRSAAVTRSFRIEVITRSPGPNRCRRGILAGRSCAIGSRRYVSGTPPSSGGERVPGRLHELRERRRVVDGEVGERLAIQLDAGALQPMDQLRVREPVLARARADPGDPQPAELALAVTAVAICVLPPVQQLFLCHPVLPRTGSEEAFCLLKHLA